MQKVILNKTVTNSCTFTLILAGSLLNVAFFYHDKPTRSITMDYYLNNTQASILANTLQVSIYWENPDNE